jgi:glycosyltransferase involved in cell wall biosynthesis
VRILQVLSHGYAAGGAEASARLIKAELTRRGHEVRILSADTAGGELFSDWQFPAVDAKSPLKSLRHLFYSRSYQALRQAIAEFRPDVIHFHTLTSCTPSVLFATEGVPAVLTIHGPEEFTLGLLRWFMAPRDYRTRPFDLADLTATGRFRYLYYRYLQRPIYQIGFHHLARVIAPSRYIQNATAADFAGRPMVQIYNGIVLPPASPAVTEPRLLFVGRLERVKGVDVLLNALAAAKGHVPGLKLRIVGDGPQRAELEALTHELSLDDAVTFAGWIKSADIPAEYAAAGALVIPSVWPENLPTVCIEAMGSGLPVIGSDTGGIPELIQDGITGQIVPVGNPAALAAAITKLCRDPELMRSMSQDAVNAAQTFSIENFGGHLEALYSEISHK